MDEELREELAVFKYNMQIIADELGDLQELVLQLKNNVDKKNSMDEIPIIAEDINCKVSDVMSKFYTLTSDNCKSVTLEDILKRIKFAIENKKVNFDED